LDPTFGADDTRILPVRIRAARSAIGADQGNVRDASIGLMRFRTTVELGGKTATAIVVPEHVVVALSSRTRAAVRVTVGGHTYRTTVASMGGRFFVPLSADNRTAAGVAAGDNVKVDVEIDADPREVTVPADLAHALARDDLAKAFFARLSYTHRKEWVRWIDDAKKAETRAGRVANTVESLRSGTRSR
jgi:hypothetical protein